MPPKNPSLRPVLAASALLALLPACLPSASDGELELEARGSNRPDRTAEPTTCTSEPSTPAASGAIVVDGDPARATSVRIEVANRDAVDRHIGARLRAIVDGQERVVERAPVLVRAGATASLDVALAELRLDPSSATLPVQLAASLAVRDADGSQVERISLDPVAVGPSLAGSLRTLLRAHRLREADVGLRTVGTVVASVDQGSTGGYPDQLLDPDIDGNTPWIPPNYSSAEPDGDGLFHYDICLSWPVSLDDAGFGEDLGVAPEGAWKARGGKAKILRDGQVLFDGHLDADGCTGTLSLPFHDNLVIVGYSIAEIGGNTINAVDANGNAQAWVRVVPSAGGSGTKYYTLPLGTLSNLIAVPAYVLTRFGTVDGETLWVHEGCRPDGDQCCNCAVGDDLYIQSTRRKFLIGHEVGHFVLWAASGGFVNDCSGGMVGQMTCATTTLASHAIDSLETQSCAAMEGWAHFVAVRAFNSHVDGDNPGAILEYWRGSGLTVDVEQGPTGGVDKLHETLCGGTQANAAGFGVELDWLRAFWDYHTNPSPGYRPDTSVMVDELASSATWTNQDTYFVITDGIATSSGDEQQARWIEMATWNGIVH